MFICTYTKLLRELTNGENIKSLKDRIIIKLQIIYSESHSAVYFFLLSGGISGYYNHTFHGLIFFFFKSFCVAVHTRVKWAEGSPESLGEGGTGACTRSPEGSGGRGRGMEPAGRALWAEGSVARSQHWAGSWTSSLVPAEFGPDRWITWYSGVSALCLRGVQKQNRKSEEHWSCSVAKLCPTLWDPMGLARQAPLSFTIS